MLEILISSSVLILILAILRLILRDKISARLQYALWLAVAIRLLMPVSFFHSPVSVAGAAAPAVTRMEEFSSRATVASLPDYFADAGRFEQASPANNEDSLTVEKAARGVWCLGMGVMTVWFLFVNLRFARRLKRCRVPYDHPSVVPVYVAEDLPSPCLFGLIKPSVYLTERSAEDDRQARQIIAHELTHYRHGDMIWALLRNVCLVVWWFNPLVWLAAVLSRRDCEFACDEGTIRAIGEEARFDYGRTLVGMAKLGAKPSDLLCGATAMTTGKKSLKERVARIAKAKKMSVRLAVLVLVIVAAAVGCTFSGAVGVKKEADTPEPTPTPVALEDITYATDTNEVTSYGEEIEYYASLSAESWILLEDSVLPIIDGWYVYHREEDNTDFEVQCKGLDFDADGNSVSVHPGSKIVIHRNDDGTMTGMVYRLAEEPGRESEENLLTGEISLGTYDWEYWEEVERELASFADSADVEVYMEDSFDVALPEDDIFGSMTMEDYIYGTDSWQFEYNGWPMANEPVATIVVHDADGRTLQIMDDADALLIVEADGSLTRVTYGGDPVDCADMIRHLLPWARGEYQAIYDAPKPEESAAGA